MKDLLRFDTIAAMCALLISTITAGAMVYQTRVLQEQFSATVWPYLGVNEIYDTKNLELHVTNEGVGPALIRSAQVLVDGKPLAGWNRAFFSTVFGGKFDMRQGTMQDRSVDASTAIRPGEDLLLLKLHVPRTGVMSQALHHNVTLRFCYCSINERCWTLESSRARGASIPVPVSACKEHYAISAQM